MKTAHFVIGLLVLVALSVTSASGLTIPSADGSDGTLDPGVDDSVCVTPLTAGCGTCQIDLDLATDCGGPSPACDWQTAGSGDGVYDGEMWAVVYKYASVNIDSCVTLTFARHSKRAPVVWLVQNDVTIDGLVDLSGSVHTGAAAIPSEGGPGGYRGGGAFVSSQVPGSAGFGPGGANYVDNGSGGSYGAVGGGGGARPVYGGEENLPLLGGSGGGADANTTLAGGGAGGGAILIAAGGTITVDGEIRSNGGDGRNSGSSDSGGGSGGALRLVADTVTGSGVLNTLGGGGQQLGGIGRIRIEANTLTLSSVNPPPSWAVPSDPPDVFPTSSAPTLTATQLDYTDKDGMPQSIVMPLDPVADFDISGTDLFFETSDPVTLHIAATNVPLDWTITVRVVPLSGTQVEATADPLVGDASSSTTTATFSMPMGVSAIQLRGDAP